MNASQSQAPGRPVFKAQTADDLRDLIGQAELIVANLSGAGPKAQTLLCLLDTIHELMARLKETGIDLRAETVRVETVEGLLRSKDAILVREMRQVGGLAAVRNVLKPARSQWWWYLDELLAARRRRRARRWLLAAGGVVAVLLVLWSLYHFVFPPDPRRLAAMDKASQAEELVRKGELAGAVELYRQAAEITPDDAEMHVWVGVLEAQLGHAEESARAFARAEQLVPERDRYLVLRGMAWLQVGRLDSAQADGEAALAANPDNAEACLLIGGVHEARGEVAMAIEAFQKAADLAEKAGNSSLVVMAKTRLAMLLQAAPVVQPATATPAR